MYLVVVTGVVPLVVTLLTGWIVHHLAKIIINRTGDYLDRAGGRAVTLVVFGAVILHWKAPCVPWHGVALRVNTWPWGDGGAC